MSNITIGTLNAETVVAGDNATINQNSSPEDIDKLLKSLYSVTLEAQQKGDNEYLELFNALVKAGKRAYSHLF